MEDSIFAMVLLVAFLLAVIGVIAAEQDRVLTAGILARLMRSRNDEAAS